MHNGEPFRGVLESPKQGRGRGVLGDLEVDRAGLSSVGGCGREEARHAPQFPGRARGWTEVPLLRLGSLEANSTFGFGNVTKGSMLDV